MREQLECTGVCLGMGQERVKSLRINISEQINMGTVVVGICYRPDQEIDEAFFKQLKRSLIFTDPDTHGGL